MDCFTKYTIHPSPSLSNHVYPDLNLKKTPKIIPPIYIYFVIILISIIIQMQTVGAGSRRKSYANVQPILPRKSLTRESGTRTIYQQLPNLSQELKSYRRRLVFSNLGSDQWNTVESKKKSLPMVSSTKFTNYTSQGSNKKNNTLITAGSETELKYSTTPLNQFSINPSLNSQNPQNQHNQNQAPNEQIRLNIDDDNPNNNNQDQNQGYTMGNQVQIEEEKQEQDKKTLVPKNKTYATSQYHSSGTLKNIYEPGNQAEFRMEQKYLLGKFQNLRARRQDNQFLGMINQYKVNKKQILKQSTRKVQSLRTLANIKRASSLPRLGSERISDKVQQIIVPSYEDLINPDGDPVQYKRKLLAKRLENSVSFGRLQLSNAGKKNKDINYEGVLEEEIGSLMETERILREKGIKINSNTLKNSLLNLRQLAQTSQEQPKFPSARLVSNPFQPKQAPKKNKKKK